MQLWAAQSSSSSLLNLLPPRTCSAQANAAASLLVRGTADLLRARLSVWTDTPLLRKMPFLASVVTLLAALALAAAETVLREQIWGTVLFTMYGDRTPYIYPETYTLTPLGARQLYTAGSSFRNRYIDPPTTIFSEYEVNSVINGISIDQLNNDQIDMESTPDQFIVASAQAFIQGLYPPLTTPTNDSQSVLANGSTVLAPLNGYQYPSIYTASDNDDNSIWIAGEINCPMYTASQSEYYSSPEYASIQLSTQGLYDSLDAEFLSGIFSNASIGYFDAYYIYDYLSYAYIHNSTVANSLSADDLLLANILADDLVFAMNGNISASGSTPGDHIRAIGGRTLATRIMEAMYTNIDTAGDLAKMTLLFGSFEPMVSFAALAGLATEQSPQFYSIPSNGASMVFELFSLSVNDSDGYPDNSDLNVRFLYQNGTTDISQIISYPLFGNDPSEYTMPFDEFESSMQNIWIQSVTQWCDTCGAASYPVFCPAFTNGDSGSGSGVSGSNSGSPESHGMKLAVAGVIGAVVTLALIAILTAIAMILFGARVYRIKRNRSSDLSGLKKLPSDQDLVIPKGAAGAAGAAVSNVDGPRGHERVGSWELHDAKKAEAGQMPSMAGADATARRPSFEDGKYPNFYALVIKTLVISTSFEVAL